MKQIKLYFAQNHGCCYFRKKVSTSKKALCLTRSKDTTFEYLPQLLSEIDF